MPTFSLMRTSSDTPTDKGLLEFLLGFVSDNKKKKFDQIIKTRTRYFSIVLENIFQSHNASAVLRSCDCFGIQDVHIIEGIHPYQINPEITLGSAKWLSIYRYNQEQNAGRDCLMDLKAKGYKIVATTPHKGNCFLGELPLDQKFVLVFGTELNGVSDEICEYADDFLQIPMVGFTESLNVSVSAAICLYYLSGKLRSSDYPWQLSPGDELDIRLQWALNTVKNSDLLRKEYFKNE